MGLCLVFLSKRKELQKVKKESNAILELSKREAEVLRQEISNKAEAELRRNSSNVEQSPPPPSLSLSFPLPPLLSPSSSIVSLDHNFIFLTSNLNH